MYFVNARDIVELLENSIIFGNIAWFTKYRILKKCHIRATVKWRVGWYCILQLVDGIIYDGEDENKC